MIVDSIVNAARYTNCHENIAAALKFIEEHKNGEGLEDGVYPIIPDEVIVHLVTKDTHAREEARMEIHRKFMDIHYMIRGAERCHTAELAPDSEMDYNPETDNGFWDCKDTFNVRIGEGEFYAVWPLEPHCPLCNVGGEAENVRKYIIKVKVS